MCHPERSEGYRRMPSHGGSPRFFALGHLPAALPLRMTTIRTAVRKAGVEEIAATPGFTRSLAEKVLAGL